MWSSIKRVGSVVVENIPRGAGMALGAAITGAVLAGAAKVLNKGAESLKEKKEEKKTKKVAIETSAAA